MAVRIFFTRARERRRRVTYLERIVTAVVLGTVQLHSLSESTFHEYATTSLERRTIDLPYKSIITLEEQSRVVVHSTQDELRVRVLTGEALVELGDDSSRPIRVTGGDVRIEAISTTFVITVERDRTSVTVLQGSASLSTLGPGSGGSSKDSDAGGSRRVVNQVSLRAGDHAQVIRVGKEVRLRLET